MSDVWQKRGNKSFLLLFFKKEVLVFACLFSAIALIRSPQAATSRGIAHLTALKPPPPPPPQRHRQRMPPMPIGVPRETPAGNASAGSKFA
jgi:hypothetical protein